MATTWEQLCNQALRKAKIPKRIGSAYEGSEIAKACLELFGQTRDFLIGSGDWEFARRANITLTLLKGPPPREAMAPGRRGRQPFLRRHGAMNMPTRPIASVSRRSFHPQCSILSSIRRRPYGGSTMMLSMLLAIP